MSWRSGLARAFSICPEISRVTCLKFLAACCSAKGPGHVLLTPGISLSLPPTILGRFGGDLMNSGVLFSEEFETSFRF